MLVGGTVYTDTYLLVNTSLVCDTAVHILQSVLASLKELYEHNSLPKIDFFTLSVGYG